MEVNNVPAAGGRVDPDKAAVNGVGFKLAQEGWEVSKILAARETGGEREYLVRWEGFTERANSWMTEENLDSPQLVNEFFRAGLGDQAG